MVINDEKSQFDNVSLFLTSLRDKEGRAGDACALAVNDPPVVRKHHKWQEREPMVCFTERR